MLRPTGVFEPLARQLRFHVQILLVLCFITFASALSDESSAITSAGTPVNAGFINGTALGQDSHYLYKRAGTNRRNNVVYTSTCSDDQVTFGQFAERSYRLGAYLDPVPKPSVIPNATCKRLLELSRL